MAIDPRLGYDPTIGALGPQTKQQWIAMMTASLTLRFLNGEDMTENEVSNAWMQANGFNVPALQAAFGVLKKNPNAAVDPMVQAAMAAAANAMFTSKGVNLPDQPGSAVSDGDAGRIADATRDAAGDAAATARQAASDAAANARNNASIAGQKYDTDVRAGVDRDTIAANERMNAARIAGDQKIAGDDRVESARQFDLQIAEDRRQFTASIVTDLFKTGIELAKAPVDWLGLAYFNEKVGLPLTMLGIASSAMLLGAIPPTGPSAAGPMVGGPAVMDGDLAVAQSLGIQNPGFVGLFDAVQQFAGAGESFGVPQYSATASYSYLSQEAGGGDALERMVAQGRTIELTDAVVPNPVVQQAVTTANQVLNQPPAPLGAGGGIGASAVGTSTPPGLPVMPGTGRSQDRKSVFGGTAMQPGLFAAGGAQPPTMPPANPVTGGGSPVANPVTGGGLPPVELPAAPPSPAASNGTSGTSTGGASSGIYTGVPATPSPTQATGTGAQTPQGNVMLQQLATELGIPYEQLTQVIDPALIAGGYSREAIANSPAIKAIRDQQAMAYYRTAPATGTDKFGQIQAFGIPLGGAEYGFRGGQDLNAKAYLDSPQFGQQMIEGAVKATGQSWNDVLGQSLRTSPITNYDAGAFGRRRFGV